MREAPQVLAAPVLAQVTVEVPFLVFTQEYWPELCLVTLPLPITVPQALTTLAAVREPNARALFPVLIPVLPQPRGDVGFVLALPEWPFSAVPVLVDRTFFDGRVHSALLSPAMNRRSILSAVGIADDPGIVVYARDWPWAIADEHACQLQSGDLIVVANWDHPLLAHAYLADMLLSPLGWDATVDLPGHYDSAMWVLTTSEPLHVHLADGSSCSLRASVAQAMHAPCDEIFIRAARPPVSDHAEHGVYSRNVVVALLRAELEDGPLRTMLLVFLDLRPILLGFERVFVDDRGLHLEPLVLRFSRLCPAGFRVQVRGRGARHLPEGTFLNADDGEVFPVAFVEDDFASSGSASEASEFWSDSSGGTDDAGSDPPDGDVGSDHDGGGRRIVPLGPNTRDGDVRVARRYVHRLCAESLTRTRPSTSSVGLSGPSRPVRSEVRTSSRVAMWRQAGFICLVLTSILLWSLSELTQRWCSAAVLGWIENCGCFLTSSPGWWVCLIPHAVVRSRRGTGFALAVIIFIVGRAVPVAAAMKRVDAVDPCLDCSTMARAGRAALSLGLSSVATPCRSRATTGPGVRSVRVKTPSRPELRSVPMPAVKIARASDDDSWGFGDDPLGGLTSQCLLENTILRRAVRQLGCPAFPLAVTLVEALFEHFGVISEPVSVASPDEDLPAMRPLVTLEQCIPAGGSLSAHAPLPPGVECFSLDVGQCLLPCSRAMFDGLLQTQPFAALHAPPRDVPDPDRFAAWVADALVGRSPGTTEKVVVTSDGSFLPSTGQAGWAIVVSLVDVAGRLPGSFIGCCYGSLDALQERAGTPLGPFSPYIAELAGLFWAAVLALRLPSRASLVIRADSVAALRGAEGACQLKSHVLGAAVGSAHLALRLLRTDVSYEHVRGHRGDCANELADGLAALGARGRLAGAPLALDLLPWFRNDAAWRWLPHWCMVCIQPDVMPPVGNDVMSWDMLQPSTAWNSADIIAPFTRALEVDVEDAGPPRVFSFACATFNALSLLEPHRETHGAAGGLYGAVGRTAILAESLRLQGVFIAGIQEARTPQGTVSGAHFVRYCSGCTDRKSHGVEIWIAHGDDWPHHRAVTLHATHTRLVVRLTFSGLCLFVLSAHAPHRATAPVDRAQWWDETTRVCTSLGTGQSWLLLMDANARIGSMESDFVGGFQADVEDDGGAHMHALLQSLQAWVPATFSEHMRGPGGTLLQKLSQELQRSDYVCLPSSWRRCHSEAWVEPSVSSGHAIMDHMASIVRIVLLLGKAPRRKKGARIDRDALLDPANQASLEAIFAGAPRTAWTVNVNEHVASLVGYLHKELLAAFPLQRRRMHKSFLSIATGDMHQTIAALRKALRNRMAALRLAHIRCAFIAWRGDGTCFDDVFQGAWLRHLRLNIGLLAERLHGLGRDLRRSCRADKRAYLEDLACQANAAGPNQMHDAIKKLIRPKQYRRHGPAPLPQIRRLDGTLCRTHEDIVHRWREHFSDLEGGFAVDPAELASQGLQWQASVPAAESLLAADMPDFCDVMMAFRNVNPKRAAGQDCIPPAICRRFACQMSVLVWPVLLKSLMYNAEPLGLKGGVLYHIDKASASDKLSCQSQRGILAQSAIAKVLHKSLRRLVLKEIAKHTDGLHLGGRPGASFVFGSFCSRTFLDYAKQAGLSSAILFTDLIDAYYAVVREAVLGEGITPLPLCRVIESLGMTESDVQELQHYTADSPVLQKGQCSELLRCLLREFHSFTWFSLHGDSKLVWTNRGTRPGGCLADAVFSLLFVRVLRRRGDFRDQGHCPVISWSGLRRPQAFDPMVHTRCEIESQDIVYADDLATCLVAETADSLPAAVAHVTGVTIDTLAGHGLTAHLGPRKTAALLCPVGQGAKHMRTRVFSRDRGRIAVLCDSTPMVSLSAVACYRHLGSMVTFNGSLIQEVRTKMGLARGAFKEGKQTVFCARCLDLDKRVALFRSHVLSIVLTGAGSWPSLCQTSWHLYEKGLFALFRQLLRVPRSAPQQLSRQRILARLGLPSPLDLLQSERLRFLGQLARSGPDQAWTLLQRSPRALRAFWDAGDWLLQAVANTTALGGMCDDWDTWQDIMHLQHSERCCQAVAQDTMDLLPVLDMPDGPVQAEWTPGDNWDRVPTLGTDISIDLLRLLRATSDASDSHIFDMVAGIFEPFPMLGNTLDAWIRELPDGQLRDRARDVALCWDVSLLCDAASAAPSLPAEHEVIADDLEFRPDLRILPPVGQGSGIGLAVAGFRCVPCASRPAVDAWHCCDFATASMDLAPFSVLGILFPAPPCVCLPFWRVPSCTLRLQRLHALWLQSTLTWISAALAFARSGRHCSLCFAFSSEAGGQFFEWLEQTASLAGVSSPLLICFTC
eukprot:s3353_g9.t1